jgi:hypothetical protein
MSSFSVSFQIVPMSPDCPFLIAPSVFSNVYFLGMSMKFKSVFFYFVATCFNGFVSSVKVRYFFISFSFK